MNDRPPLWTWAASLALAAMVVAGLLGWANSRASSPEVKQRPAYLHLERLRAAKGEALIAVVGSSLTRCGIAADSPMENMLRRRGSRARVVRVSRDGLTLDWAPMIWAPLLKSPPRILILESNILRFARAEDPLEVDWRIRIRDELLRLNPARKPSESETENVAGAASSCGVTTAPRSPMEYRDGLKLWRAASPDQTRDMIHQLRALERQGTRIWILDLPRNPRFQAHFPEHLRIGGDRALRQVLGATHAQLMPHRPAFSAGDFEDAAHLRPRGQARLSNWLADRIAHHLAEDR